MVNRAPVPRAAGEGEGEGVCKSMGWVARAAR